MIKNDINNRLERKFYTILIHFNSKLFIIRYLQIIYLI